MIKDTLADFSQQLAQKKISSVELTQYFLAQIAKHNHLNSFITVCESVALEQAKHAD